MQLLMVARHESGASQQEIDNDAILMRAYGNRTDLIIDRDREATSHRLLADRGMAPPLFARFQNGLLYGFVPGKVCKAQDLTREPIWRGVARKLGEWHAKVPISGISEHGPAQNGLNGYSNGQTNGDTKAIKSNGTQPKIPAIASRQPIPNVWSVMQNWISALSTDTDKDRARKEMLQREVELSFQELDNEDGIGEHGLVFAHCDLLCANVIELQNPEAPSPSPSQSPSSSSQGSPEVQAVTFIDYEYATPAPAVFDISNHFAEWAGYDCDYSMLPTKSVRRGFIEEYISSYSRTANKKMDASAVDGLYEEVDRWRGIPGLYWGIWSLIQARISEIDFDYSAYAEERLGEYFAWRNETKGSRTLEASKIPLRERRWAED
jgi:ethanolamine kinase